MRFDPKWLLIRPNGDFVKGLITSRLYYQGCSILWLFIYWVYIFRYFGKFITETFVFCSKLRKKLSSFLRFQVRLFFSSEAGARFYGNMFVIQNQGRITEFDANLMKTENCCLLKNQMLKSTLMRMLAGKLINRLLFSSFQKFLC